MIHLLAATPHRVSHSSATSLELQFCALAQRRRAVDHNNILPNNICSNKNHVSQYKHNQS